MKGELGISMKQLEERKKDDKQKEAAIDQLHKKGPPMMQEIDSNQRLIEEKTKMVNQMQGDGNYTLMLSQRKKEKKQKYQELAEY